MKNLSKCTLSSSLSIASLSCWWSPGSLFWLTLFKPMSLLEICLKSVFHTAFMFYIPDWNLPIIQTRKAKKYYHYFLSVENMLRYLQCWFILAPFQRENVCNWVIIAASSQIEIYWCLLFPPSLAVTSDWLNHWLWASEAPWVTGPWYNLSRAKKNDINSIVVFTDELLVGAEPAGNVIHHHDITS